MSNIKGIKLTFPDYPLFQAITQKLKTQEIYLQIENQNCYLIRSGTEQLHRLKIGDLSQTPANNFAKWMKEFGEQLKGGKDEELASSFPERRKHD